MYVIVKVLVPIDVVTAPFGLKLIVVFVLKSIGQLAKGTTLPTF
jgi:hypothetical protein